MSMSDGISRGHMPDGTARRGGDTWFDGPGVTDDFMVDCDQPPLRNLAEFNRVPGLRVESWE